MYIYLKTDEIVVVCSYYLHSLFLISFDDGQHVFNHTPTACSMHHTYSDPTTPPPR